jgi:hypothetical protein
MKSSKAIHQVMLFLFAFVCVGTMFLFVDNHQNHQYKVIGKAEAKFPALSNGPLSRHAFQSIPTAMTDLNILYVIPGGGGGSQLPEWTKQRLDAALVNSMSQPTGVKSAFLLLSVGSLNSPSTNNDKRNGIEANISNVIKFECQLMMDYLQWKGVSQDRLFGDFLSWDIVTNGLTLRMYVEALMAIRRKKITSEFKQNIAENGDQLCLEVFTSDFHTESVKESFSWILNLQPSLLSPAFSAGETPQQTRLKMHIHSVSSVGVTWPNARTFSARVEHEASGAAFLRSISKEVLTIGELYAYLLMGPHKGPETIY